MDIYRYDLIGIGEFSHGIQDIWEYRFNLIKSVIKSSDKKIVIFNEMSIWQAENVVNRTYYDRTLDKFIPFNGIRIEKPISGPNVWGKLWQYINHSMESKVFLRIIKYVRKHNNRISLIGVDNDTIDRDFEMSQMILSNLGNDSVNFFWAHNYHVDSRPLNPEDMIGGKSKYTCGYYLRAKLGQKYCIVLSQAFQGENRFNGYCIGRACKRRTWQSKYFYKKFKYSSNKKYIRRGLPKFRILEKFDNTLIEFSNSYYKAHKYGYQYLVKSKTWDYILFYNKVTRLEPFEN